MAIGNLQQIIPAFFIGPNGQPLTPEQIAQRQEVAKSLLQQATDTSPNAGGWASVLAKGLQGGIAGYQRGRADDAAALNAKTDQANIEAGLGAIFGGGAFPSAVAQGASPTSGAATGTATNIPQAPEIRQGLIDRGLQPHIADAFILNFQDESGLNPGINEAKPLVPGSRGGYGLYQLTGPRRREYEAFAAQRGVPLDSVDAQLDFLMNELQGSEAEAAKSILSAPDTATAAQAIVNNFLRPAPEHRQARAAKYGRVAATPQEAINSISPIDPAPANPYPEAGQVAPHDFTDNQTLSAAASLPMQGITPEQFDSIFNGQASAPMAMTAEIQAPQQPQIDPRLAALNDQMLGGALSPTGRSEVAQALTGYFPEAPSANRAPITAQNNAMSQAPMQQPAGGVNPQIIASLLGPNSSPQARQVGALLIGQYQRQQAAMQAQQQAQQELAQRQQVALSMGIDPNVAMDVEAWKAAVARANRDRSTVTVGNTVIDANTMQPIYEGQRDPTTDIQNYEYARQNGYGGSFADYQQEVKRAGATNVSTVVGGDSDEYRKEFEKSMGAATAKTFTDAMNAGDVARRNRINLDRISQLASSTPQGLEGATKRALGEYGIKTEGLDKVQAMESLISQMVPSQRPPGSGTISDADLALYKASLPRLINSPEGNSLILETLYAINDHDIAASDIAARVAAREITPTEARKLMRQIPNPFDDWREKVDITSGEPANVSSKEQFDSLPSGSKFIAPDGSIRIKP